jgi:tetratricopeptide repeat protein
MRSVFSGLSALVLAASILIATKAQAAERLLGADEVVGRYVDARGGAKAISQIRTLIYRGIYHEGKYVSPHASMAKMRPFYKLVGDPEQLGTDFAEGYDGSAWEYYGDPGIVVRTVGAAAAAARHGLWIEGPLVDYREKGSTIEVRGIEKIGGREAYWLRIRMRDGFEEDEFIDRETWMPTASRKVAPVHAFGRAVASETRFDDFRPVAGVLFPFAEREVEIATGRVMNEMQWREIVANRDLDPTVFSPPSIQRTPLQSLLDHLYLERSDRAGVIWSYSEFRRAHPDIATDSGIQAIGYQIVKMGEVGSAIALLEADTSDYPTSSGAFFGLGRAYRTAGRLAQARQAFEKALALDSGNERARGALAEMKNGK